MNLKIGNSEKEKIVMSPITVQIRKKGSLTLTVSVEPMPNSDGNALVVKDEIKLKLPEFARDASLFFADDDRNLVRQDPRQLTFEGLREVPPPAGVDPKTGEVTDAYKGA